MSENNRKLLCESLHCPPEEIQLIYNGAKAAHLENLDRKAARREIREELGLEPDQLVALTVGQLHLQKGYFDLVPVIPDIIERRPDVRFVWVGDGVYREELKALLEERGLGEHVRLLGRRNDVPRLLLAADLFVFPTRFEGFPFSLLEAASHGLPFITTDASSICEFVEDRVHGVVVPEQDQDALKEGLLWALDHPSEMRSMAEKARERVADFSEDKMIAQTLAVLDQLSGRPPRP